MINQHWGWVFSVCPFPLWWLREFTLCLLIIIKSEVWTIIHYLGLGHETMVCAVCLYTLLVQVMAWCRQATSHYLSQCWPRSLSYGVTSHNGVTRPQWVKIDSIAHPFFPWEFCPTCIEQIMMPPDRGCCFLISCLNYVPANDDGHGETHLAIVTETGTAEGVKRVLYFLDSHVHYYYILAIPGITLIIVMI